MNGTETQESRMERKLSLARERDTRVVITRTVDTMRILDIVRHADRGIRNLRSNILIRYEASEVVPLLEEYTKAVEGLHLATKKICEMAGLPYRPPRSFREEEGEGGKKRAP